MIKGTKEAVKIYFPRFRDAEGLPTWALNFDTGDVCAFLRVQRFGTEDVCVLAEMGSKKLPVLDRRYQDGKFASGSLRLGSLIPADSCVLFKMKDGEEVT